MLIMRTSWPALCLPTGGSTETAGERDHHGGHGLPNFHPGEICRQSQKRRKVDSIGPNIRNGAYHALDAAGDNSALG